MNGIAQAVYNCMNFSGFSTAANTDMLVILSIYSPFFAPAL